MSNRIISALLLFLFLQGCSSSKKIGNLNQSNSISQLQFLGEYDIPNSLPFKGTIVGGLSGIDYDADKNVYYLISDDPSSKGPTRFYTAQIHLSEKGIDSVPILEVTALLNPQGEPYADITKDRIHSADVEAMRYDKTRDELIWASEGQRFMNAQTMVLQDPSIVIMNRNGRYKDSFELPANMHTQAEEKGPRHNGVFEGVSFDKNYRNVYVSVEDVIYEDGPRAGIGDSTAWIRILKFDRATKKQSAQYAYKIDPVPYPPNPPGAFRINGVSDILYLGENKFMVIERAFSTGRQSSAIRVYLADISNAEDISSVNSLFQNPPQKPIKKRLLLNMDNLNRFIDNIEGVTFGPVFPNGHHSLIFVADDNFSKTQKTQFLLFEVIP
ncbi:MAG TPA: esterase-like activity of phytase family protein [Chitinophagaceae bacterium]|jgi:hypothetical protein|nr:esterase-like activity of phytase family protein [Chitinophagaceae bacterium]